MTLYEAIKRSREYHICFCSGGCPDGANGGEEFYRGMGFCGCWCHKELYDRISQLKARPDGR